ncbi:MAG: DUF1365 domain-containing protein [Thermoleophilaceae bacterium]|nr:DUF1365 domain-containing protein [Thermoleophilaceae bacterium]
MNTCLYEGLVHHRRCEPVEHAFTYRVWMAYLDLEELPGALDSVRGFSARRPALARFKRSDYFGDPAVALIDAVRERAATHGAVRVLTNLRTFGHIFNPVSFYYCFDRAGALDAVLTEVTNTPWGERHSYVLREGGAPMGKAFHVSPFMHMHHSYTWELPAPGESLSAEIAARPVFEARLALKRRELSPSVLRRGPMSLRVLAGIYGQAVRLKLKGAPYFPHPERAA